MTVWVAAPEPFERFSVPEGGDLDGPGAYHWERASGSYVGMASSLWSRLGDHRRAGLRLDLLRGGIYPTQSTGAAGRLESALIWLLDPTENRSRPDPGLPLWAGTLGLPRPVQDWSWYPACGHVLVDGHVLGYERGCSHRKWNWAAHVRRYVEALESGMASTLDAAERCDEVEALLAEREGELRSCGERLAELEDLRERADWTP